MGRTASTRLLKYTLTDKSRRYKRNLHRPVGTIMTRSRVRCCGDIFQKIPSEVFHMILDKLSRKYRVVVACLIK